jgi:hypothetical protein
MPQVSAEVTPVFSSRFAGLSRSTALAIVAAASLAIGWCLFVSLTRSILPTEETAPTTEKRQNAPDTKFYEEVTKRVRAGQPYHEATRDEFARPFWSEYGFRPTSIFNWRTPIYAWVMAPLSNKGSMALAGVLALTAALVSFLALGRTLGPGPACLTFLLVGPFAWCGVGEAFRFTELWAGILIALSVAAYGIGRWPVAVLAAIVALFFRELALPYCLLCFVLAIGQRRWAEVGTWVVGFGLFAIFYAWHMQQIRLMIGNSEETKLGSWLQFGGTAFALAAVQLSNVFLTASPAWLTAIVLPLALLGLAGWRSEAGTRAFLTCVGYLVFFLIAGQPPYNAYWGLLIGPLLMLGLAALPIGGRDLFRVIRQAQPAIQ